MIEGTSPKDDVSSAVNQTVSDNKCPGRIQTRGALSKGK